MRPAPRARDGARPRRSQPVRAHRRGAGPLRGSVHDRSHRGTNDRVLHARAACRDRWMGTMVSGPPMTTPLPVYVVHWNAPDWVKSTTDAFLASTIATRVTVIDNGPDHVAAGPGRACARHPHRRQPRLRRWRERRCRGLACRGGRVLRHRVSRRTGSNRTRSERLVGTAVDLGDYGVVAARTRGQRGRRAGPGGTTNVTEVAWASGTCLLLRRALIADIGGFDEDFGSYGEDIDLCYRRPGGRLEGRHRERRAGPGRGLRPTRVSGLRCT